jgi:hypothetical protein
MHRMLLKEWPRSVSVDAYARATERMTAHVSTLPGVVTIFQIGHTAAPGISDIDMLIVFDDHSRHNADPRSICTVDERYLFIHKLYGASQSTFEAAQKYSFFHNYELLWGAAAVRSEIPCADSDGLKGQVAMEYLLKELLSLKYQLACGIVKIRSLLLHANGLRYDLEFLGITSGPLVDEVARWVGWRACWFTNPPSRVEILNGVESLLEALESTVMPLVDRGALKLPDAGPFRISRRVKLSVGQSFACTTTSPLIPIVPGFRHVSAMFRQRVIRLNCELPGRSVLPAAGVIQDRFSHLEAHQAYNRAHLNGYAPLGSSLHFWARAS